MECAASSGGYGRESQHVIEEVDSETTSVAHEVTKDGLMID